MIELELIIIALSVAAGVVIEQIRRAWLEERRWRAEASRICRELERRRCATCGKLAECRCEPPIVTAQHGGPRCEACGRGILEGERVYLSADEDEQVVTHVQCPPRASA